MLVTVTLAPATAFPCGSVTEPVMLPYTACPRDVLAQTPNTRHATSIQPRIACFLITPLLSTIPHRIRMQPIAPKQSIHCARQLVQRVPGPPINFHSGNPGTLSHEMGIDGYRSSQPDRSEQPPRLLDLVLLRCPPLKKLLFRHFL